MKPEYKLYKEEFDIVENMIVDLSSHGDNLADLLDNATYILINDDGDISHEKPATDKKAEEFIVEWYYDRMDQSYEEDVVREAKKTEWAVDSLKEE